MSRGSKGTRLLTSCRDDNRRRADITNERLPPELIDADEDAPASPLRGPGSPSEATPPMLSSPHESPGLGESPLGSPMSPGSPDLGATWKPGHGRRYSLGTTGRTAPSNRRRSLDQTMALMKEVMEGTDANGNDTVVEKIAENLATPPASPTRARH
jgi:serine/threonine-protein phosphatase 2B catalytic subunit